MSTSAAKRYTVEEYLALEGSSETKHQYFDGEIFDMAGGSIEHSLIATNFSSELRSALKDRGCRVLGSDMAVSAPRGLWTYPDVSVVCEKPEFHDDEKKLVLLNPLALIEVLSDSTESFDRGKKFESYKTIESLREYILVSQDQPHVDHFARQPDNRWLLTSFDGLGVEVELPALGCSVPLVEIFAGVDFPKNADGPTPPAT